MLELLAGAALAARFGMLADRDGFALAVSGGPDSLALLVMIARWRDHIDYPGKIVVLSVDHQLRAESADEVVQVGEHAAAFGFAFVGLSWDGDKPASGLASAARAARFALMVDKMNALGLATLVLGHHRDDQGETLLMRMAHGSGIAGLGGMAKNAQRWGIDLVRPLLDLPKVDLVEIVSAEGLRVADDPSNVDLAYERVRWRGMLGALESFGLSTARLALLAQRMAQANAALDFATMQFLRADVRVDESGIGQVSRTAFLAQPREIGQRVLIELARVLGGSAGRDGFDGLELAQAEALYGRLRDEASHAGVTCAGVQFVWRADRLHVGREVGRGMAGPLRLEAGHCVFWDNRFEVSLAGGVADACQVGALGEISRRALEGMIGHQVGEMKLLAGVVCVRRDEKIIAIAGLMPHKDVEFLFRKRDIFAE